MQYTIKCADASDAQCEKNLTVDIPILDLTTEQLDEISNGENYINITLEQIRNNNLQLKPEEKIFLATNNFISYEIYVETICGACGSDYTRDNNGNIID